MQIQMFLSIFLSTCSSQEQTDLNLVRHIQLLNGQPVDYTLQSPHAYKLQLTTRGNNLKSMDSCTVVGRTLSISQKLEIHQVFQHTDGVLAHKAFLKHQMVIIVTYDFKVILFEWTKKRFAKLAESRPVFIPAEFTTDTKNKGFILELDQSTVTKKQFIFISKDHSFKFNFIQSKLHIEQQYPLKLDALNIVRFYQDIITLGRDGSITRIKVASFNTDSFQQTHVNSVFQYDLTAMQIQIYDFKLRIYKIASKTRLMTYSLDLNGGSLTFLNEFNLGINLNSIDVSGKTVLVTGKLGRVRDFALQFFEVPEGLKLFRLYDQERQIVDAAIMENWIILAGKKGIRLHGVGQQNDQDDLVFISEQAILYSDILAIYNSQRHLSVEVFLLHKTGISYQQLVVQPMQIVCKSLNKKVNQIQLKAVTSCSVEADWYLNRTEAAPQCSTDAVFKLHGLYGVEQTSLYYLTLILGIGIIVVVFLMLMYFLLRWKANREDLLEFGLNIDHQANLFRQKKKTNQNQLPTQRQLNDDKEEDD